MSLRAARRCSNRVQGPVPQKTRGRYLRCELWRTSSTSATAISPAARLFFQAARGGAIPGVRRMPRWCPWRERSHHRAPTPRGHGNARHRVDCTPFPRRNEHPYPASVQDINYALRWTKLNARALETQRTSSASRASRAAGISLCSSPCGRAHAGHPPDLSKTGDMYERLAVFVAAVTCGDRRARAVVSKAVAGNVTPAAYTFLTYLQHLQPQRE